MQCYFNAGPTSETVGQHRINIGAMFIVSRSDGMINPFNTGTDFRRPILTSKVDPRTERINI